MEEEEESRPPSPENREKTSLPPFSLQMPLMFSFFFFFSQMGGFELSVPGVLDLTSIGGEIIETQLFSTVIYFNSVAQNNILINLQNGHK